MGDQPELRISDADRQRVVDLLRRHTGEGRLTLDEFAERAEIVFAARTRSDLEPALAELPPATPAPAPAVSAQLAGKVKRRHFVAVMSGLRRRGRWRVPEAATAFAFWGGVDLDLREAVLDAPVIDIRAWAIMGGVEIIVPEGVPVEVDGFVLMGGHDDRTKPVPWAEGAPLIRVHCYGMWGAVVVRSKAPRQRDEEAREAGASGPTFVFHPPALPAPPPLPPLPRMPGHRHHHRHEPLVARPEPSMSREAAERPRSGDIDERAPAAPLRTTGTVSILVTDIVGSTAHAERLGDQRWLAVLQSHNALVREQLGRHGGTEVKQSGDGFLATFTSARAAVRAGLGVRRAIEGYRLGNPDAALEVRVGIHAGEVESDGDDVFGVNVSTAARLAGVAEPGEVVVSGIVRDLADSTSDLRFGEPREVTITGRAAPVRVHTALDA